ncbi:ROK family transcriptional regulator [Devosia sp. A449]
MAPNVSGPGRDAFDSTGRGLQHQGLRRANERAVLMVIAFNSGVSNAEIARLSGLAPQTVSAILTDLDRAGLITRGEVLRGRRGQPATPISLRAEGALAIGVEIGWHHIDVLLLDLHLQVSVRQHRSHDFPDACTLVGELVDMIGTLLAGLSDEQRARTLDIGIALPNNIADNLALVAAPEAQRALWQQLDLVAELERRTCLTVSTYNDGNAACWAELIAFDKPRPSNFIYFLISRYIAAGIVGQGTLWEGPSGNSANLGSMLVGDADGQQQAAHFVASVTALEAGLKAAGFTVDPDCIEDWDWVAIEPVLEQWIIASGAALARVVHNTMTVIETGLVVLDSILPAPIVARLVTQLEAELRLLPVAPHTPPQVLSGHLGRLAPAIGAAELTLYRRFFSRTLADLAG